MIRLFLLASAAALSGCANFKGPDVTRFMEPEDIQTQNTAPASARAGTCWAELTTAPVLTSVTAQILTKSAERTRASETVEEGETVWFERPCETEMTSYFIESLQRALAVRKLYSREIDGEMNTATRFAIRLYQQPLGLDSGTLSLSASRALGLSRVQIDTDEQVAMAEEFPQQDGALYVPETDLAAPSGPRPVPRP